MNELLPTGPASTITVDVQVQVMLAVIVRRYVPADELVELEPAASFVREILLTHSAPELPVDG